MDNSIDTTPEVGYNVNNESHVVIAKMDEIAPTNDTECKHETLIPDPTDTIGDATYYGCSNPKCGRGFYLKK